MDELKPCPFCGSKATLASGLTEDGDGWAIVSCKRIGISDFCAGVRVDRATVKAAEKDAIKKWNTRAERTCRYVEDPDTGFELCSECGAIAIEDWTADYCWACGAKVVQS